MFPNLKLLVAGFAVAFGALPAAAADITYEFRALSAFVGGAPGGFRYTSPGFVTGRTEIALASLDGCDAPTGLVCANNQFLLADGSGLTSMPGDNYDAVIFQTRATQGFQFNSPVYYFENGAFGRLGTFNSVLFGTDQQATITISALAAGVPEPATWASMIVGFGMVGGALRRMQRARIGPAPA